MSHDTLPGTDRSANSTSGRTRTITLAVVLIAELMNALDGSVVYTALPSIQADTGASTAALQWIHAAYALTFALGLITGGRLGDLYGRKLIFIAGTAAFTLASLLCGIATDPALLICARVLQGAAAAAMVPQVLATLHVTFDMHSRAKAFGLYGTVMSLGSVAGPVLGGVLTQADLFGLGWRPVFLVNLPIGIAAVVLGLRFIPESRDRTGRRPDLLGMGLSALGLLLITLPLTVGGEQGWPAWAFAMMIGGVLVLAVFVAQQRLKTRKGGSPLIVLTLFRGRGFSTGLATQLIFGLLSGVFFLSWTLFMQDGLGLNPGEAAVGFVAASLGEMAGAWLAISMVRRHGRAVPQTGALLAAATLAGYHHLITTEGAGMGIVITAAPMLAVGLGLGMVGAPLADLTLGRVAHHHAGSASGLFNTSTQLGIALGTALTTVVLFNQIQVGTRGPAMKTAFAGSLWYVIGALAAMWALMFLLPNRTTTTATE
ncbi:MFS transporter [Streptomyces sp. ISL-96]|uniref:MFS transporter n=1 Tax=Streptomyces sp. ISL-96 TaxID=2819191 RepID=UPI001BE6B784|nr:MFS transporter [Streptomyces sp. ISL-96]MBT2489456.1 MFS transporter [Streptomyces sp. ISL-96]